MSDNICEFPLLKTVTVDEARSVAERIGAANGVVMWECPCGCGKVQCIHIGEPTLKDLMFFAEILKSQTLEDYLEEIDAVNEVP